MQGPPSRAGEELPERAAFLVRRSEESLKEAIAQAQQEEYSYSSDLEITGSGEAANPGEPFADFGVPAAQGGPPEEVTTVKSELIKKTKNLNGILSESAQLESDLHNREVEIEREDSLRLPQQDAPLAQHASVQEREAGLGPWHPTERDMDKHAGEGKAKRPSLPKLPLENLNIGPFGYSGFAQPLDSLDSSSHTLLTDYGPASMQAVGPDEHLKADEPEGEVPL